MMLSNLAKNVADAMNRAAENDYPEVLGMTDEELAIDLQSYDSDFEATPLETLVAAVKEYRNASK